MGQLIQFPKKEMTAEMEYDLILSEVEDRIKYYSNELDKAGKLYNLLLQNKDDDVL